MTNSDKNLQLPKRKFKIMNLVWIVVLVAGFFLSVQDTDTHISDLFKNFGQFSDIFVEMCHPDWNYFSTVLNPLIETIKMAILGTFLGSIIAFVYSFAIARNIVKNKIVVGVLKIIMNIIRTVPDLLLGAIFAAIVGIGPLAGVLALTVFTFGVVVKLFYEAIETLDPGPIEAMVAVGANKLQIICEAVLPQVITYFISYVLYAFEINVRASTVLGYVGAGGIGVLLQISLGRFNYAQTGLIILVIFLVVFIIDYISSKFREAVMK